MRHPFIPLVLLFSLTASCGEAAPAGDIVTIQDFEQGKPFDIWPEGAKVEISRDWAADGKQSVKLGKEAMIAITELRVRDWTPYQILRIHARVPGGEGIALGLELADNQGGFLNRHQNAAAAPPGESVIEVDISGDLWRGEVNKPYRLLKTPLDKKRISRIGITAQTGEIYVDRIELAKVQRIAADGAFAFEFGKAGGPAQSQWIPIDPGTRWDEQKGFGLTGGAQALQKATPYPTPVLGDGIAMHDARFEVRLKGGRYLGWVLFERSGFWEDERSVYAKAAILVNGKVVHEHSAGLNDAFFRFQDIEVLTQDDVVHKLVMPRAAPADIAFDAVSGKNTITLRVEGERDHPPRLAGLVLAPDTPEGRKFIEAHKALQHETIAKTHRLMGRQQRTGDPAKAKTPLVTVPLRSDAEMYPGDWPAIAESQPVPPAHATAGVTAVRVIGLYAARDLKVNIIMTPLTGPAGTIGVDAVQALVNRYLPLRDYEQTACWIASHHYRPASAFDVSPTVARSVAILVDVPAGTAPGIYAATLTLACTDPKTGQKVHEASVPLSIQVHPGTLPPIDMPSGLFYSGVPVPKDLIGDDAYWKLTASMMHQMRRASLTMVTGGPDYSLKWDGPRATYSGADCVKLLRMAREYGLDQKVTSYGGFAMTVGRPSVKPAAGFTLPQTYAELHRAWDSFRSANNLPEHLVNTYDEPGTPDEFAPLGERLRLLRDAGFKTIGFTSMADPQKADENHKMLAKLTHSPAVNLHSPETLACIRSLGNEPWIYNNGLGRPASGVDLWRARRAGAAGRLQWIGAIIQGYQFDALDSREPDPSCFFVHKTLGVLVAPRYLGSIEGGFDARLLFELERRAKQGSAAAQKITALFAEIESRPYRQERTWEELDALRLRMLELLR